MQDINGLTKENLFAIELDNFINVYQEIAVMRMNAIRESVIQTREFIFGITDIFYNLRAAYDLQYKNANTGHITLKSLKKNGKNLSILLTTNTKFSGSISQNVFSSFFNHISSTTSDIVVAGNIGKQLYDSRNVIFKYKYIDMPQDELTKEATHELIGIITQYERVDVFYGQFVNLVSQLPARSNISGSQPTTEQKDSKDNNVRFIFEPSLDEILKFFDTQISSALLKQTLFENKLATLGSRVNSLETAKNNINDHLKNTNRKLLLAQKNVLSKRQMEQYAGMQLWYN